MGRRKKYNWERIKLDFFKTDGPVELTLQKYGIPRNSGHYNDVTRGWLEERQILWDKAVEKAKERFVDSTVNEFESYINLINATRQQIAVFLKNNIIEDKKGKPKLINNNPSKLANIAYALDSVLKSHRLIRGKSTENVEQKNYHMALVELIDRTEKGELQGITLDDQIKEELNEH